MISSDFKGKSVVMSECVNMMNSTNVTFYEAVNEKIEENKSYVSLERRFLDYMGVCIDQKGDVLSMTLLCSGDFKPFLLFEF